MEAKACKANANSLIHQYFYDNPFAVLFRALLLKGFAAMVFYQIY
jgi:hypothetical protein